MLERLEPKFVIAMQKGVYHLFWVCMALSGLFSVLAYYPSLFEFDWGLAELSKLELIFLVVSIFLFIRIGRIATKFGTSIFQAYYRLFCILGLMLWFEVVILMVEIFVREFLGENLLEVYVDANQFTVADELIVMVAYVVVFYFMAPFKKADCRSS